MTQGRVTQGPITLLPSKTLTPSEAASRGDPSSKSVPITAKKVGASDVICVDSGMDGAGTCCWGHAAMVAKGTFVVRP